MTAVQRRILGWLEAQQLAVTVENIVAYYEATNGLVTSEAMRSGRRGVATRMFNALSRL